MKNNSSTKGKVIKISLVVILIIVIISIITSSAVLISNKKKISKLEWTENTTIIKSERQRKKIIKHQKTPSKLEKNDVVYRDQQNLVDWREPNAKVDVGFDSTEETLPKGETWNGYSVTRDYWGYTNSNEQLVFVQADEIILQDDILEEPWEEGIHRYSSSVSSVDGTGESYTSGDVAGKYDRGHVIADSLGGMSIAYNVTPEDSVINQTGTQADFEGDIRSHGGAKYFKADIKYPNKKTNVPVKYYISYIVDDEYKEYTFSNQKEVL